MHSLNCTLGTFVASVIHAVVQGSNDLNTCIMINDRCYCGFSQVVMQHTASDGSRSCDNKMNLGHKGSVMAWFFDD